MGRECPSGLKILIAVLALFSCIVLFLGLWQPDKMTYFGKPHMHLQPWMGRLSVAVASAIYLSFLWLAARGQLWTWYVLLALFALDLITQLVERDVVIGNLLIDVTAMPMLISAIRSRAESRET